MISLDDVLTSAAGLHAAPSGPIFARSFDGIAYDTRTLRPGDLFVAVGTERADGHEYVIDACRRGAAGVLVQQPRDLSAFGATCIVVDDTRAALIEWARLILARQRPDVIAIAGGVGKTSTERALVRVLSFGEGEDESIFDNGNLNDLFGLPVALGGLRASHAVAVIELASDSAGEMAELVDIVRPRTGVITNLAPVHLRSLGGMERLIAEQTSLLRALPEDGWAVVNGDDEQLMRLVAQTNASVRTFGLTPGLDLWADDLVAGSEGLALTLVAGDDRQRLHTRLLGFHNAYTLLAAAAAALTRGCTLAETASRLEEFAPLPGRLRPLAGLEGSVILDDSQSASPRSVGAAIEALSLFPGRKIVVLGDIADLDADGDEDEAVPAQLAGTADLVVTLGKGAEAVGRSVLAWGAESDRVIVTESPADVAAALTTRLTVGDAVLVKGTEASRMERVVERLLADPATAPELLVRQDPGWKQRIFLAQERPTWIEIDLAAIGQNVAHAHALAPPKAEIMIVLKADAYGHGAVRVARTALLHGASMGAVACLSEAIELREAGVRAPVLLLGYVPPWQARDVVRHDLSVTLFSLDLAAHLSRAAVAIAAAPVRVHVKVDTGMSRLGLMPEQVPEFLTALDRLPGIAVEGIFTHFATADEGPDDLLVLTQLQRFRELLARLRADGRSFRYVHAANSAALLNQLGTEFNLIRLGILAYGLDPSSRTRCPEGFEPALSFKTRIAQVKALPAGACVSYGCAYVTLRPSIIAVIPVGYGDGFRRSPCNWGEVLVRGARAPIVGNVCMDMCMLDVTDVPGVKEGDEVVLIGAQGDDQISADDVARRLGTINYEVVTQILPRVPRTVP